MSTDKRIEVLDYGYTRLIGVLGDDLNIVNAARVSFEKESVEFEERDQRLISFLGRKQESSPFRQSIMSFEIYAPMIVKNQWYKYVIGSDSADIGEELHYRDPFFAWNESSRRYITEDPLFYVPSEDEWRSAPENKKQGSAEPLPESEGAVFTKLMDSTVEDGLARYNYAINEGVAPEQARGFLPAYFMYIRWRWTASVQGVLHFLNQRLSHDAQKEIQLYAEAIKTMVEEYFPAATKAFLRV